MTWHNEDTDQGQDIVFSGMESGIAPSANKGTANLQNVNISTETGEVMASYDRIKQSQIALSNQTATASVGDGAIILAAPTSLVAGQWVKVTASSITSITAATNPTTVSVDYLVVGGGGGGGSSNGITRSASGGGAGGQVAIGTTTLSIGTNSITIGAGGVTQTSSLQGSTGSSTILGAITTVVGGSGGGSGSVSNYNGVAGTNGGGGGVDGGGGGPTGTGGVGTNKNGGNAAYVAATTAAGGGGAGNGANGTAGSASNGGAGGTGTSSSITGTSVTYAGGGGGGGSTSGGSATGGGGAGVTGTIGTNGTVNTGGGGGAGGVSSNGGTGGSGIVVVSYTTGTAFCTGGTVAYTATKTVHTFTSTGVFEVVSINSGGYYFVSYANGAGKIKLSATYDPYCLAPITHGTSGTATFSTITTVGSPIAKAVERFGTTTDIAYRYYILDSSGYVWVYDTAVYASSLASSGVGTKWMLPDYLVNTYPYTGMGVLNGFLFCLNNRQIYLKPTVNLGQLFVQMTDGQLTNPFPIHNNFVLTGHQGKLHYCDSNYIGEIFPTTSFITSVANIQSYGTYIGSASVIGTISPLLGGSTPWTLNASGTVQRIPAVFFTSLGGTLPTSMTQNTVYYIEYNVITYTFIVYTAITGGTQLNLVSGATGTQYYNTFWPIGTDASDTGTHPTVQFTPQRVDLPFTEEAQCLVEIGNTILIGCTGNTVYPWNQIDATPSDLIALPERDVQKMINVNNMVYMFAGNKGNVYITNGSVASMVLTVPDYCAGVPGIASTYIEPYFSWGDAMYLRGRVYFSILDQTATKAGNCGGVWSFVPTQNLYQGQDIGQALRLENQNSYATYSGVATVLLPSEEQNAISPQYWSGWQDNYSVATSSFGIDFTATTPVTTYVVETDLLPTGTMLSKNTYSQLEYKLSTALQSGDSVQLYYRTDSTSAWTTCGTTNLESTIKLSGYYDMQFQATQWIQFRAVVTTSGTTASSFVRLAQIILR